MYYIIMEELLSKAGELYYLKAYDNKKKSAVYSPDEETALRFENKQMAQKLINEMPETIRGILHAE